MKIKLIEEFNPIDKTPKIWLVSLGKGEKAICKICGIEIKINDYCYFDKSDKIFNCLNCVRDGLTEDKIKTGSVVPLIMDTFSRNVYTVKLAEE